MPRPKGVLLEAGQFRNCSLDGWRGARRPNPVFSAEYRALVRVLRLARAEAGLSQRTLAARLGKAASHVAMIERGQRRVDALEFYFIAHALGVSPAALFERAAAGIATAQAVEPAPERRLATGSAPP